MLKVQVKLPHILMIIHLYRERGLLTIISSPLESGSLTLLIAKAMRRNRRPKGAPTATKREQRPRKRLGPETNRPKRRITKNKTRRAEKRESNILGVKLKRMSAKVHSTPFAHALMAAL